MNLYDRELQAADSYRQFCLEKGEEIHPQFLTDENKLQRYLQPAQYDNQKAFDMIKVYLEWQASFDPRI